MPDTGELADWFVAHRNEFVRYCKMAGELGLVSDEELGKLLFHQVWDEFETLSPKRAIVEEAFKRLGFIPENMEDLNHE